jgi:hypothetical protein
VSPTLFIVFRIFVILLSLSLSLSDGIFRWTGISLGRTVSALVSGWFLFFILPFHRIWFWVQDPPHENMAMNILLYGSTVLIGAGGSTLLVTSLSMVADLIGCTVVGA